MGKNYDKELGLDRPITRRDFIYGSSLLVGSTLAGCSTNRSPQAANDYAFEVGDDWYGPGGFGDYRDSHGNTPGLVRAAHEIHTGRFQNGNINAGDTGERFDLIIVGAGFAGLSAAHHFYRLYPRGRALILDNHPIFGGEAKRNDFDVDGYHISGPQGSNDFAVQEQTGDPDDYFTALGLPREYAFAEPEGSAAGMRIPYDNYDYLHWHHDSFDVGHYFGDAQIPWVKDLWRTGLSATSWSDSVQSSFQRLRQLEARSLDDPQTAGFLDSVTLKYYYDTVLGMPPEVTSYYDPIMASIAGLGCDALSAYWGSYFDFPGFVQPRSYAAPALKSFPGGNAAIARHFVKRLNPQSIEGENFEDVLFGKIVFEQLDRAYKPIRIRLNSTAVRVEHEGDGVAVYYLNGDRVHKTSANAVVMASGGWVNKHILPELPEEHRRAYDSFLHSPVLVVNVALRNWRFLQRLGIAAAIWSGGFGYTCNIRRPMIVGGRSQPLDPDQPIVLTFYTPIYKPGLPAIEQGIVGRAEMLGTSFDDYERQIREQMLTLFADGGLDPANDIAGIVLNRWGHAYVNPGPGFIVGDYGRESPPDIIRKPIGRIAIGHSELRGHQYWTGAAGEGRRAVELLLDEYF